MNAPALGQIVRVYLEVGKLKAETPEPFDVDQVALFAANGRAHDRDAISRTSAVPELVNHSGTITVSAEPVSSTMLSLGPAPRGPQIRPGTMMRSAFGSKRVIFTARRNEASVREYVR